MGRSILLFILLTAMPAYVAFAQKPALPDVSSDSIALVADSVAPVKINQPFYDADGVFIGTYHYTGKDLDSTTYIKPNGRKLKVLFEMPEYEGGYDALQNFFEEEFRKIENKEEDMSALALVYILLEDGEITDIRIGDRIGYHNFNLNYDTKIKEILRKTQKNWITPDSRKAEPLLFVYLFNLN